MMRRSQAYQPLTLAVAVLCLIAYVVAQLFGLELLFSWLHFPDVEQPEHYWQLWRFISPIFIHFSLMHIGFNLVWWWILGNIIEQYAGLPKLLSLLLLSGLLSNMAQYPISGAHFGGLSGVVYGLFGYLWVVSRFDKASGVHIPNAIVIQIVAWLMLGFTGWLDDLVGPMANMAHLIGLVVGLLLALSHLNRRQRLI